MTYGIGNPDPGVGQAQQCGSVKPGMFERFGNPDLTFHIKCNDTLSLKGNSFFYIYVKKKIKVNFPDVLKKK